MKIPISKNNLSYLQNNIILIFTGIQRKAQNIEKDKFKNIENNYHNLMKINEIVKEARKIFFSGRDLDLLSLSELLNESWFLKKSLSTNSQD